MKREYDLVGLVSVKTLSIMSSCCVLCLSSCTYNPPTGSAPNRPIHEVKAAQNLKAAQFNQEFALAVSEADVVIVREHSHPSDLNSSLSSRTKIPKYTYIAKELNFNERMIFVEEVKKLKGRSRTITTECLFVPHHSVELYKNGKQTSVMEISYDCGEIKWNGSPVKASGDMFDAVTPLLKRSGMKVHRDWHSKAEDKFVSGDRGDNNPTVNLNPNSNSTGVETTGPKDNIPTAKWVSGQEGKKVTNPFTGATVDVEGIPASTKVRDPDDEDATHIFRVPGL